MPILTTACAVALLAVFDVSGSMTPESYDLQQRGVADALDRPEVQQAFRKAGPVAFAIEQFADSPTKTLDWVTLDGDPREMHEVAEKVRHMDRAFELSNSYEGNMLSTGLADAIAWGVGEVQKPGCDRMVMDVSGDGSNNSGVYTILQAHNLAVKYSVTINGLPVKGEEKGIEDYYANSVVTKELNGFNMPVDGYEEYGQTFLRKLLQEVTMNNNSEQRKG